MARGISFRERLWPRVLLLVLCAVLSACANKTHAPELGGSTQPPDQVPSNQPCSEDGTTRACGRVERTDGNYVTCSMGHSTCQNGTWSACVGDHFLTKSVAGLRLTRDGLSLEGTSNPCGNACDPYCQSTTADPNTDVPIDAGIASADAGGITLEKVEQTAAPDDCKGLQCSLVVCPNGGTTTISGTVYDPAGNNPLYDANVYIPLNPDAALPPFGSGAACDTCGGADALDALRAVQTDASGKFTLTDVPVGANIPIVVQMGKWRREIVLTQVQACSANAVSNNCTAPNAADCVFRLPRNHTDGYDPVAKTYTAADMPRIAIVTGSADPFDCLLLKAGIDPTEIGDSSSSKRVHYYSSADKPGNKLNAAYGSVVSGSTLWNDLSGKLMTYDVVLLPCEGGAIDKQSGGNTPYQNLISYANAGGRAFITHFGYVWLEYPAGKSYVTGDNWSSVANWAPTGTAMTSSINTQDPMTGYINTSFPKGNQYSQWLSKVGASTTSGRLTIHEGRQDLTTIGSNTQPWMTARDKSYAPYPNYTNLFTFNTPYSATAANQCGRVVFSDFHVSANALVGSSNKCLTDLDCGYTATCSGETAGAVGTCSEPCLNTGDCPNSGFACNGAVTGTCQQTSCTSNSACGTGRFCQSGSCTCNANADCDGGSCSNMTCQPVACTSSTACGKGTCGGGVCNSITCHSNTDCGLGSCGGTGKNGTCAAGFVCHSNADCGPTGTCGTGTSSTAGTCSTNATICHAATDCDSNSCGTGAGSTAGTCPTNATVCHKAADCDSNSCGTGTGATAGACNTNATVCHLNTDCDSGSCGSGSGATAGTCSYTTGRACHLGTDCDSGFCGSGTGATAGTCSTNSAVCHANTDCDSGSCGSGTGSALGTCAASTGAICHLNSDCDSGSCGTGTGATAGTCSTTTCHLNTDCDSGSCGSGTGSATGTCSTGATACHKNADCDSASCGAGTGSVKGVCTAGTCTSSAQCGSTGVCTGGKCVAGACSLDSNCGTANGICTGATCSTKTCANDTACGVGKCNGAKCSTLSCVNDTICSVSGVCNNAKCSTAATCANDAACGASKLCNGAKCSTLACAGDAACGVSKLCNGAKCSTAASCAGDNACPASKLCTGSKCSTATCAGDAACSVSKLCNNAKCSTATCAGDFSCPVSKVCNGAKCSTATCAGDAACSVSKLCNNAKCSTSACGADAQCPLKLCTGAKCTPPTSCGQASDCGTTTLGAKCTGATCSANSCTSNSDCGTNALCGGKCTPFTCTNNTDCPYGTCNGGVCACGSDENCGGSQTCSGITQGACQRSCSTNADCAPDLCVNGKCGGCTTSSDCHDGNYTASCNGVPAANYGTCTVFTPGEFPAACRQGTLSAQEKALEFMFFDLTACVAPDNLAPPKPAILTSYGTASFTQDFTASCGEGLAPYWREFDWQADVPSGTSIDFAAQSGADAATLLPSAPLKLGTTTASTNTGPTGANYDALLIDTGKGGTAPFDVASPPVASQDLLRITITLNPSSDKKSAPTIKAWKIQYDCLPAE